MTRVSSTPTFSGMKYRVVNQLGTGAGSTILLISDKTAGGKRYALKVVASKTPMTRSTCSKPSPNSRPPRS